MRGVDAEPFADISIPQTGTKVIGYGYLSKCEAVTDRGVAQIISEGALTMTKEHSRLTGQLCEDVLLQRALDLDHPLLRPHFLIIPGVVAGFFETIQMIILSRDWSSIQDLARVDASRYELSKKICQTMTPCYGQ